MTTVYYTKVANIMGRKLILDKIAIFFSKIFQRLPHSKYFKRKVGMIKLALQAKIVNSMVKN